jgi:hypothetical protein
MTFFSSFVIGAVEVATVDAMFVSPETQAPPNTGGAWQGLWARALTVL